MANATRGHIHCNTSLRDTSLLPDLAPLGRFRIRIASFEVIFTLAARLVEPAIEDVPAERHKARLQHVPRVLLRRPRTGRAQARRRRSWPAGVRHRDRTRTPPV